MKSRVLFCETDSYYTQLGASVGLFRLPFIRNRISSLRHTAQVRLESSPIRLGLSFKLLIIVVVVSLIGVLVSFVIALNLQQSQLITGAQTSTNRLSNVIQAGLEHSMLRNDRETTSEIIGSLAREDGVEHIRILDARGVIRVSSTPGEVGQVFGYSQPDCQFCHVAGRRPTNDTAIRVSPDNHRTLLNINVIKNSPQCQSCHDPRNNMLGLLIVEMPLDDLNLQLATGFAQMTSSALATMILLVGLMFVALRVLVIYPVHKLARGMTEIRSGNLDYPVQVPSRDELGDLAETFDVMRREVKASRSEMEERTRQLATLNDLALGASALLDVHEILELALDTAINRLEMQAGAIYLADPAGVVTLHAARGISDVYMNELARGNPPNPPATGDPSAASHELSITPLTNAGHLQVWWDEPATRQCVQLALISKKIKLGTLVLIARAGHSVTEREQALLKAVGHEVAIAVYNAQLLEETRRREQEAVTLYRLMTKISSSLEIDQVLTAIAEGARLALDADIGAVGLLDELGYQISVKACSGCHTDFLKGLIIPAKNLLPTGGAGVMKPVCIEEWKADLPIPHAAELVAEEGIVSSLAVPMWSKGRLYGFVGVMTRRRRHFTTQDSQLFMRLVMQVVVAVENADLYKQVRYMATLEERDRLAREMHDNLAQMLGFINIKASLTDELLAKNQIAQARASLLELKEISKEAYTDVRDSIFSLRTAVSTEWGLFSTLRDYVSEYRAHYGIDAQLFVQDENAIRFPAEVEVQVNRIIQEALTNVRKHSGASWTWVRFEQDDHHIRISVEDNGHGFDPNKKAGDGSRHFGLQIMRERAESAGGEFAIYSRPNSGTRVVIELPTFPAGEGMK